MKLTRILLFASCLFANACASAPCPVCPPEPAHEPAAMDAMVPTPAPAPVGPLIFDATPDIPMALKASLIRYLEARSASVAAIAEDGKSLLIATRLGQANQLHRVATPGGARTQVTFEAEPVMSALAIPGTTGAFFFMRDTGGDERFQYFRSEPSGETRLVTDGRSRNGALVVSADGSRIAYSSNARNGKDMDLWLGDGRDPASAKLLAEVKGQWSPIDWSRDGKSLLVQEFVSIEDQRLHLVDVATGAATLLTPDRGAYRTALFAHDGKRVFATTDKDGDFVQLQSLELATRKWSSVGVRSDWNVESVALSGDGKTLATVTNEDGYGVLRLLDAKTGKEFARPKVPKGVIGGIDFADQAPVLAFSFGGSTVSGDAYTYELGAKKVVRWTFSEVGGLDEAGFVEAELVRFKTFDGREIPAFYYRPAGAGPFPVVINIHGGPESQARPNFSPLTQYLVTQSQIAVLVPNVRGSDGYGKAYLGLDNGKLREDSVKDIGALVDWIGQRNELDAKRVAVMGGSYGGYMVLASLVHLGQRLVAGIDVVGISNFVTFLENTAPYRRDLRRAEYGDESDPAMREFLASISPLTNVGKIESALFVVHGANDPRVPLGEAEQIVAAVRKGGREAWKLVAMNEGHGFAKRDNRDAYMQLSVMFLEKHLGVAR